MSNPNPSSHAGYASFCSAATAALLSFVALIGMAAVVDGPQRLGGEAAIPSEEIRLTETQSFDEPARQFHAVAAATGRYEDPGLQVTHEVHA